MVRVIILLLTTLSISLDLSSQVVPQADKTKIQKRIDQLRSAHLESNTELANQVYHNNLVLVSQSGKKYGKEDAIRNIQNKFEFYENAQLEWLSIADDVVLTTFLNRRKFKDFPQGRFRLVAIWKKESGDWQLISLQSSRLKKR